MKNRSVTQKSLVPRMGRRSVGNGHLCHEPMPRHISKRSWVSTHQEHCWLLLNRLFLNTQYVQISWKCYQSFKWVFTKCVLTGLSQYICFSPSFSSIQFPFQTITLLGQLCLSLNTLCKSRSQVSLCVLCSFLNFRDFSKICLCGWRYKSVCVEVRQHPATASSLL